MYLTGKARWDSGITPPEVVEAFEQGNIPPGAALDLGCGTGTNAIFLAQHGRKVIGLDFAPEAIARAKRKVRRARLADQVDLRVADVSRIGTMNFPPIAFALDIGCFHGLSTEAEERYAEGLAQLVLPGGWFMLYTHDPEEGRSADFGITPEGVHKMFGEHFTITREERGEFRGGGTTWFWMTRKR
jgi:SAM-dependent methyltransferase